MFATAVPNENCLPHLHVIAYRRDYPVNVIKEFTVSNVSESYVAGHSEDIQGAYAKAVALLKLFLRDDRHAAEYLLLSLISRTQRRDGGLLLGDLNINLSGVSPEQASLIIDFIKATNPLTCTFDATVESLSATRFTPLKNYDTNQMEEGLMGTLTNNSVLIFNETTMVPG